MNTTLPRYTDDKYKPKQFKLLGRRRSYLNIILILLGLMVLYSIINFDSLRKDIGGKQQKIKDQLNDKFPILNKPQVDETSHHNPDTSKPLSDDEILNKIQKQQNGDTYDKRPNAKPVIDRKALQNTERKKFRVLPETSIWCYGQTRQDRICRFQNLYYHPKHDIYFAVLNENSILDNVPRDRSDGLVDQTSIDGHSSFKFDFEEVDQQRLQDVEVNMIQKKSFVFQRFHVGNIMHTIHDDIVGLYYNMRRFSSSEGQTDENVPDYARFSTDVMLWIVDGHKPYEYAHLFQLFSDHKVMFKADLIGDGQTITMFNDVIIGQSKSLNWYQYGFLVPQGPIENKQVNGFYIRECTDFIQYQLGLMEKPSVRRQEANAVVVFSRKSNRIITNEDDLLQSMAKEFNLEPHFIRMEEMNFFEQVKLLRRTKIAIGMHGSILIMGLFMPRKSILIEMYPYAVPPENYTPYKTMSNLPGVNLIYKAWKNTHKDGNIAYPNRDMYHGGLKHLSEEERRKILESVTVPSHICCTDPYWLFRIYQDTVANVPEILKLAKDAYQTSQSMGDLTINIKDQLKPFVISESSIVCRLVFQQKTVVGVLVNWNEPWYGGKPDYYKIWEHVAYKEFKTNSTEILLQNERYVNGAVLQIYIKSVKNEVSGKFSNKKECKIELPQ